MYEQLWQRMIPTSWLRAYPKHSVAGEEVQTTMDIIGYSVSGGA
jgi:hypothetical protein